MADISVDPWTWSTTASSNSPSGSTAVGTGLDDNLRAIQAAAKSQFEALSSVAGTNTITGTCTGLTAYATGQRFAFVPANTNTGATTLNVTSLGAKNVFCGGRACIGGELKQNQPVLVMYDGTQFQIVGPLDINTLTADGSPDQDNDYVQSYDASASGFKKVLVKNLKQLGQITNSLAADVSLNNTGSYFDGPSVAQGTTGTWFASGTVTVKDTAGASTYYAKLHDGTTVIASTVVTSEATSHPQSISLSGYLASPAGNIRISVKDISSTSGKILFNETGNSVDSTLTALRIA